MVSRRTTLWLALAIVAATAIVMTAVLLHLVRLPFTPINILGVVNSPQHWTGWIGSIIILVVTTGYVYAKRMRHTTTANTLRLHAFGNLLGFLLVYPPRTRYPAPESYPDLGTGVVQYAAVLILGRRGSQHSSQSSRMDRYCKFHSIQLLR
jgi:hypothetical protein